MARPGVKLGRPGKPRPDFPLFPHATGRWAKKVRGKLHYFGPWSDPDAALAKWERDKDALLAGKKPRPNPANETTVKQLVNDFLTAKQALVDTGEITARRWSDLYSVCEKLVAVFGTGRVVDDLDTDDFEALKASFGKTHGLATVHTDMTRVRAIFNWGAARQLIAHRDYGKLIPRPTAKAIRRASVSNPKRPFSAAEIQSLLAIAPQPLKAMILLGINCGYGNNDVALLTADHLDLDAGWADMPRPKTGAPRRAKLWPETMKAIRETLEQRPNPKDKKLADRVFITAKGLGWEARVKQPTGDPEKPRQGYEDNPISKQFSKLLTAAKIRRGGNGFYTLRRMFETIGGGTLDQAAVDFAMGHVARAADMGAVYRLHIDDKRLEAIAAHLHDWLWPARRAINRKRARAV